MTGGSLDPVWAAVRDRLERRDGAPSGRVRLPALSSPARMALGAVLGRAPGKTVDLAALEAGLVRVGVGSDLPAALAALGFAVAPGPAQRRAERRAAAGARTAARECAMRWADDLGQAWVRAWIDDVIRSGGVAGLGPDAAVALVRDVRRLIDDTDGHTTAGAPTATTTPHSRVDLAARLFGDAHALDTGTRLEAAATRALALRHAVDLVEGRHELWHHAGVHLDLTSAPALTWRLPVDAPAPLAHLAGAADDAHIPLHLSQFALRRHPISALATSDVLVVENPRVVEAAAQRGIEQAVVATNGNPSTAVQLLLTQLLGCGATLRYHGDFDAAGFAICGRMASIGLVPWRMDAGHYLAALDAAEADEVQLPIDASTAPLTPWDPQLQATFDERRLVVHEERLLDELLGSAG